MLRQRQTCLPAAHDFGNFPHQQNRILVAINFLGHCSGGGGRGTTQRKIKITVLLCIVYQHWTSLVPLLRIRYESRWSMTVLRIFSHNRHLYFELYILKMGKKSLHGRYFCSLVNVSFRCSNIIGCNRLLMAMLVPSTSRSLPKSIIRVILTCVRIIIIPKMKYSNFRSQVLGTVVCSGRLARGIS